MVSRDVQVGGLCSQHVSTGNLTAQPVVLSCTRNRYWISWILGLTQCRNYYILLDLNVNLILFLIFICPKEMLHKRKIILLAQDRPASTYLVVWEF